MPSHQNALLAHEGDFHLMTGEIRWNCKLTACLRCAVGPDQLVLWKPRGGFWSIFWKQPVMVLEELCRRIFFSNTHVAEFSISCNLWIDLFGRPINRELECFLRLFDYFSNKCFKPGSKAHTAKWIKPVWMVGQSWAANSDAPTMILTQLTHIHFLTQWKTNVQQITLWWLSKDVLDHVDKSWEKFFSGLS